MKTTDRIHRANARSRRLPGVLWRIALAWVVSAILIAILVPLLHARGVQLAAWMPWTVILFALALAVGPDLVRRFNRRP